MRRLWLILAATGLVALGGMPATAEATRVCGVRDTKTKEVLPGAILTWDGSFRCQDAPKEGTYEITVTVSNHGGSTEAVRIPDLKLSHTTPRPGGEGPDATAEADGLPVSVDPAETAIFTVTGKYELVETDEGWKANLHLRAVGTGVDGGVPFRLGINVMLRG
ncbi:MAG: hypothetical protein HYU54_05505 [Actinobacteria bacterium]|nr:hypothetical protein [Actinomycetota bacterium]